MKRLLYKSLLEWKNSQDFALPGFQNPAGLFAFTNFQIIFCNFAFWYPKKQTLMKKFIALSIMVLLTIAATAQQKRVALIIGNAAYQHGGALKNPVNDAKLMAQTLREPGFACGQGTEFIKESTPICRLAVIFRKTRY